MKEVENGGYYTSRNFVIYTTDVVLLLQ